MGRWSEINKFFFEYDASIPIEYELLYGKPNIIEEAASEKGKEWEGHIEETSIEFNFLSIVDKLANKDITKYEVIFEMDWKTCLNTLTLWEYNDKLIKRASKI